MTFFFRLPQLPQAGKPFFNHHFLPALFMPGLDILRYTAAAVFIAILGAAYFWLGDNESVVYQAPFLLVLGTAVGIFLQRSRFCFFCILRDFFEQKDARPLVGLITAFMIGSFGYLVLFGAWVNDPSAGYLPQDAHIGPVGWQLLLGGLTFGLGMALSGSCISAHLYRLGEGSMMAPIALFGTCIGFILGFMAWNKLYVTTIATSPVVWLPEKMGYAGSAVLQLILLGALSAWLLIRYTPEIKTVKEYEKPTLQSLSARVFKDRWPTWVGGVGVGILGVFAYFRVEPLGVTAEIGRLSREIGNSFALVPSRLEGLDGFAGCSTAQTAELISSNGIFVLALILGSSVVALLADKFKPRKFGLMKAGKGLLGGVLLGFGAMISLGCTIGTSLSGITAFALSGWVFTIAMVFGVWSGLKMNLHK
jgi:uncharacterized protein